MTTGRQHSLDILSYWCAVELFSPQSWNNPTTISLANVPQNHRNDPYQNLPWEGLRANMHIGLTRHGKSSFPEKYHEVKFGGYQLQTDMQSRLQQPFSFIQATKDWMGKRNIWPNEADSHIRAILQEAQGKWMELTYGSETLPVGSFVSDALVRFLMDTMENVARAAKRPERVTALYLKNYPRKYREKPYYAMVNPAKDGNGESRRTSKWLRHDSFCIQAGLFQQVAFNALQNASELVRKSTALEKTGKEERLPSGYGTKSSGMRHQIASMMCFEVRDDGALGPVSSLAISQYAKAISCLFSHDRWPSCPEGWPDISTLDRNEGRIRTMFAKLGSTVAADGSPRRVNRDTLNHIIDVTAKELGLDDAALRRSPVHDEKAMSIVDKDSVSCRLITGDKGSEPSLMDSFYLYDLENLHGIKLREPETAGHDAEAFSEPLKRYLSAAHPERFDLSEDPEGAALDELTRPDRTPGGRWPSKTDQFQSAAQQLAVNQITATTETGKGDCLMGVNGPPGTGKTTLLKDVIAEIIVARARQLVRFNRPEDIFKDNVTEGSLNYWTLKPAVTGYEIVVASNNNKAVENISQDLPLTQSIAAEWQAWIDNAYGKESEDYAFRQFAETLLESDDDKGSAADKTTDGSSSAWALLAATLGNTSNKSKFIGPFESHFIKEHLSETGHQSAHGSWITAKKAFESASRKEAELRKQREEAFKRDHDPSDLLREEQLLENRLAQVRTLLRDRNRELDVNRGQAQNLQNRFNESCYRANTAISASQEADAAYTAHQQYWSTHFLRSIIHFRERDKEEKEKYIAREQARSRTQSLCNIANAEQRALADLQTTIVAQTAEKSNLSYNERDLSGQLDEVKAKLEDYRNRPKHASSMSDERIAWMDEEWNAARTELFIAALRLHQQLVIGAAGQFRENLTLASKVIQRPSRFKEQARLAAWQSLFLVVPVISSSFASISRMFGGLGKESLGWAIIDEAGQATPQSAAGLLQRVRHAVAVGDPMQLEPIDTLPNQMRELLAKTHNIQMGLESRNVQEMVDHQTRYGLQAGQWLGMPLVVHRRCDEPMFSICNDMAYSGRMVRAGSEHTPCLYAEGAKKSIEIPPSRWYDVPAKSDKVSLDKWRPAEGHELYTRLKDLIEGGIAPEQILVIAPFRVVANRVRDIFRSVLKESGRYSDGKAAEIVANQAGTVHTCQGREADVVFLVMGSAPGDAGCGSRNWVNFSPNMLNVAVSRAKRRLYVIGDINDWKQGKYSGQIADVLPVYSAPPTR